MQYGAHDAPCRIHEGDARPVRRGSGPERRQERADPDGRHRHVRLLLQSPSFLHARRQMLSRRGRPGAHTLFGIDDIPCDNHVRKVLDGAPPGHAGPRFHHVIGRLPESGRLEPLRRPAGRLPVAAGGTEYVSSTRIDCSNRRARKKSDGTIRYHHAMVGASIVAPGSAGLCHSAGIHPPPGRGRQAGLRGGCRQAVAGTGRPPGFRAEAGPSGDDLHCCQPVREAIRNAGGNFLLTCRPGSRATSCECIHGARMDRLRGTGRAASSTSTPGG